MGSINAASCSRPRGLHALHPAPNHAGRPSRIIVVDPSVVGQSHLLVNTGFIRLLLSRFRHVVVIAETTHGDALQAYLRTEVSAGRIQFIAYSNGRHMLRRLREEIARTPTEAVFFTNLRYLFFVVLNIMPPSPKVRRYWVLHSHLSSLARSSLWSRAKNWLKVFLLFEMFRANHFIVCSESIRDGFLKLTGKHRYERKISVVFHPVGIFAPIANHHMTDGSRDSHAALSLLYIQGWHKPSPDTQAVLDQLARVAPTRAMRLDIIWNNFSDSGSRKHFTKDYRERIREIAQADFFLFLPSDDYSLQASGALSDLAVAETPAIGIKTAFGSELAKIIGEFGFFFDSYDEVVEFITTVDPDFLCRRRVEFQRNLRRGVTVIAQTNSAQLSQVGPAFAAACP